MHCLGRGAPLPPYQRICDIANLTPSQMDANTMVKAISWAGFSSVKEIVEKSSNPRELLNHDYYDDFQASTVLSLVVRQHPTLVVRQHPTGQYERLETENLEKIFDYFLSLRDANGLPLVDLHRVSANGYSILQDILTYQYPDRYSFWFEKLLRAHDLQGFLIMNPELMRRPTENLLSDASPYKPFLRVLLNRDDFNSIKLFIQARTENVPLLDINQVWQKQTLLDEVLDKKNEEGKLYYTDEFITFLKQEGALTYAELEIAKSNLQARLLDATKKVFEAKKTQ